MDSKKMKLLKKYLAKDDRVDVLIAQIIYLFKANPGHSSLNALIKKPVKALIAFKSLILLHNLLHGQAIQQSLCSKILKEMTFNVGADFDKIISQRFLNPYRLFLQKRCQIDMKTEPSTEMQRQALIFQIMNIIKSVSTFQQVIYTFGRYYFEKHKFIIDFNVILARDICNMYSILREKMPPPHSLPFLKEVEAVHEVMYPVFYNNYFYQFLRNVKPKWIETDRKEQPRTAEKTNQKLADMDSTDDGEVPSGDRSFDAVSEYFGQEEDEYMVGQFEAQDKQLEKTEKPINLQSFTTEEICNFFCQ